MVGAVALIMLAAMIWFLKGFLRRQPGGEPPTKFADWSPLHLAHVELDGRWFSAMGYFTRRAHGVLRSRRKPGNAGRNAAVGTIAVRFDAVLFWIRKETITLRTSESTVDLVARNFWDGPWLMVPLATRYEVWVGGELIGALELSREAVVARDPAGEVARWHTGRPLGSVLEGDTPKYGELSGRVSGSLRVPLRRVTDQRYLDFGGIPFYATCEGDERWLLAFLALAAQTSLLIQSRSPMNPRPLNPR